MKISEPTVVLPGNEIDIGINARLNETGFVAVDLGMGADPIAFTPEIVETEMKRLGCRKNPDGSWWLSWRWRKEYLRDATAAAGQVVFDAQALERQQANLRNPRYRLRYTADGKLVKDPHGPVKVWIDPGDQPPGLPETIDKVRLGFAAGIDVGEGVGQSDSTIEIFTAAGREQAAEFASNEIRPAQLGRLAVALGRYYNHALICCVRKLHGLTVLRTMSDDCNYPMIWRARDLTKAIEVPTSQLGWTKGESSDELLFGKWVDAIEGDDCVLHSLTCWQQHRQYIYDEMGRITHQALADMPKEVRERHGDLVVASALAYRACLDMGRFVKVLKTETAPYGSFAWRRKVAQQQETKQRLKW